MFFFTRHQLYSRPGPGSTVSVVVTVASAPQKPAMPTTAAANNSTSATAANAAAVVKQAGVQAASVDIDIGVRLIALPTTSSEYRKIAGLFNATLPSTPVMSVKRIENEELIDDFGRRHDRLTRGRKQVGAESVVRELFHGTDPQYADAIICQGFDCRLAGKSVGTLYGKGSYFARDAKYSLSYCQGGNKMFVCKVSDLCASEIFISAWARLLTESRKQ